MLIICLSSGSRLLDLHLSGRHSFATKGILKEPMACGYLLHTSQAEKINRYIELLSLKMEEVSENGVCITMEQPMMMKIPLLLVEDSAYNKVDGLRLSDCSSPGEIVPPGPIEETEPSHNIRQISLKTKLENSLA